MKIARHIGRIGIDVLIFLCTYAYAFHVGYKSRPATISLQPPHISRDSALRNVITFLERQIREKDLDSLPIGSTTDPPTDSRYVIVRYADTREISFRLWRWELEDIAILRYLTALNIGVEWNDQVMEVVEYDPDDDTWSVWLKVYRNGTLTKRYELIHDSPAARAKKLDTDFSMPIDLLLSLVPSRRGFFIIGQ